jgi:hypothetical protein
MKRAVKTVFKIAGHLVILLSFVSGFMIGAIFGETVLNKCEKPTALTYFLAK